MDLGNEVSNKIRSAIKAKLTELGAYVDDELPDYIMVMVANKKTKEQMAKDLALFLGPNTELFIDWLHGVLDRLQSISVEDQAKELKKEEDKSNKVITGGHISDVSQSGDEKDKHSTKHKSPKRASLPVSPSISPSPPPKRRPRSPPKSPNRWSRCSRSRSFDRYRNRRNGGNGGGGYKDLDCPDNNDDFRGAMPFGRKRYTPLPYNRRRSPRDRRWEQPYERDSGRSNFRPLEDADEAYESEQEGNTSLQSTVVMTRGAEEAAKASMPQKKLLIRAMQEAEKSVTDARSRVGAATNKPEHVSVLSTQTRRISSTEDGITGRIKDRLGQKRYSNEDQYSRSPPRRENRKRELKSKKKSRRHSRSRSPQKRRHRSKSSSPLEVITVTNEDSGDTKFIVTLEGADQKYKAKAQLYSRLGPRIVDGDMEDEDIEMLEEQLNNQIKATPSYQLQIDDSDSEVENSPQKRKPDIPRAAALIYVNPAVAGVGAVNAVNNGSKVRERCRFWPGCRTGESCPFWHPTEPCANFPVCRFGAACLYVHPPCKFQSGCTNAACVYTHSTPVAPPPHVPVLSAPQGSGSVNKCRFFPRCTNMSCPFFHPTALCRYGLACTDPTRCLFTHPEPPQRNSLVWTKDSVSKSENMDPGSGESASTAQTDTAVSASVIRLKA